MPSHQFFVFSNPVDGQEDTFNAWYDATHLREVLAVDGITRAQRFTLAPASVPDNDLAVIPPPTQRYLAVYEVDGDPSAVMADFLARLGDGRMDLSPALDLGSVSMGFWAPSGDPQVSA
jgi:hypothetical protein